MSLKQQIPFAVRHRLRLRVDAITTTPQRLASAGRTPRNRADARYQVWYRHRTMRRFFERLVRPGDLVFDIGANRGEWTAGLRSVGCRVVAVEPQPECAAAIVADPLVTVVVAAVGLDGGEVALFIAPQSEHATTSPEFITAMIDSGRYPAEYWSRSVSVPVRTLDGLIDEFGTPKYIKLDIEGSEPEALRSLSRVVPLLSFESHGQTLDQARDCIATIASLGDYEFNVTPGEFLLLKWRKWGEPDRVLRVLEAAPYGWNNVFARLRT